MLTGTSYSSLCLVLNAFWLLHVQKPSLVAKILMIPHTQLIQSSCGHEPQLKNVGSVCLSPVCSAFLFSLPSLERLDTRLENSSSVSVLWAMAHLRGAVLEIGNFILFHESSWLICFSNPRSMAIHEIALATITWE